MKSPPAGPSVSVVIPTRNRGHLVGRAVGSVLRQTFPDLEVVVVDDASDDDTGVVLGRLDDPRFRYHRLDAPAGASAARNLGMARATGAHLAFLDSDDEWLPEKLERQLRALTADEGAGIAVCGITTGNGAGFAPAGSGDVYRRVLERRFPARCSTFLLSPAAARSGIRFDERLPAFTDWDLLLRITRAFRLVNLPDRLVVKHAEPGPRMWAGANIVEGGILVLEKHRDELAGSPEGRAAIHAKIATAAAAMGDGGRARRHLLRAVRAQPWRPLRYARLAARTFFRGSSST